MVFSLHSPFFRKIILKNRRHHLDHTMCKRMKEVGIFSRLKFIWLNFRSSRDFSWEKRQNYQFQRNNIYGIYDAEKLFNIKVWCFFSPLLWIKLDSCCFIDRINKYMLVYIKGVAIRLFNTIQPNTKRMQRSWYKFLMFFSPLLCIKFRLLLFYWQE